MAATRLQHRPQWTVADLIDRLRTEQTRLSELKVTDHDITAIFALSYRYLSSEQQRMFRLLGTHPGTDFDPPAAAALAGTSVWDAEDLLESLFDQHMVEQPAAGRYSFHDLLRQHALILVEADPEQPLAIRQLLDYFTHVAKLATDLLQPGRRQLETPVTHVPKHFPALKDYNCAMAWYAVEYRNLLAVAGYAEQHGFDEHLAALPRSFGHYLVINHYIDELTGIQEPAARAAHRLGDLAGECRSVYHLALTNYMACRYREGLRHAMRCLDMTCELGDESSEGWTLGVIGLLRYRLGDLTGALDSHNRALEIQKHLGDDRGTAICMANAGRTLLVLGRLTEACALLDDALDRSRKIADINEEASNLTTLGTVHSRLGKTGTAIAHLRAGLALARVAANADYTVRGLIELADGLRRAGELTDADNEATQALQLLGHGRSTVRALNFAIHIAPLGSRSGPGLSARPGDMRHLSTSWGTNRIPAGLCRVVVEFCVRVAARSRKRSCGRLFPYLQDKLEKLPSETRPGYAPCGTISQSQARKNMTQETLFLFSGRADRADRRTGGLQPYPG